MRPALPTTWWMTGLKIHSVCRWHVKQQMRDMNRVSYHRRRALGKQGLQAATSGDRVFLPDSQHQSTKFCNNDWPQLRYDPQELKKDSSTNDKCKDNCFTVSSGYGCSRFVFSNIPNQPVDTGDLEVCFGFAIVLPLPRFADSCFANLSFAFLCWGVWA